MNIPPKIQKSTAIPYDKIQQYKTITNYYSNALKRFYKENTITNNVYLYSKIKQWFFNLTLQQRITMCSIENPWTSIILSQLYLHQQSKEVLRFIPRFNEKSIPLFEKIKPTTTNTLFHFLNYYAAVSENYDTNPKVNSLLCKRFLENIKFYRANNTDLANDFSNINTKNYYHYFTLSTNIINNVDEFEYYFKNLSNEQCFVKPVAIVSNTNSIDIPEWAKQQKDSKLCFSIAEIFLSFFEQTICVNYIITMYSKEKLSERMFIEDVYKKCDELIEYLKCRNDKEEDVYTRLNVEQKVKDVFYCVYIEKFVDGIKKSLPRCGSENGNNSCISGKSVWPVNATLKVVIEEVGNYIRYGFGKKEGNGMVMDVERFVQCLLFLNIEQLFTYDDFILRVLYYELDGLYTRSQFEGLESENDLIAFLSSGNGGGNGNSSNSGVNGSGGNNGKKKRKKKKGKNKVATSYSLITDNSNNNNNETLTSTTNKDNNNNSNDDNCSCKSTTMINTESLSIIAPLISEIINLTLYYIETSPKHTTTNVNANVNNSNNNTNNNNNVTTCNNNNKKTKKKEKGFFLYSTHKTKKETPPQPKKSFLSILNHNIISYEQSITSILTELKPIKTYIIHQLHSYISTALNTTTTFTLEVYGSYQSELDIESSDIDIQYKPLTTSINIVNTMYIITQYLQSLNQFDKVNSITTATIPVIKLNINPEVFITSNNEHELLHKYISFKQSSLYKQYNYDHSELDIIKVDISFPIANNTTTTAATTSSNVNIIISVNNNVPYLQVEYIKRSISAHKEIKTIIKVMKRILKQTNLNNSYKGGLSSYTLFLLTNAFSLYYTSSKRNNNNNNSNTSSSNNSYSHFLIEMLKYYSSFDFNTHIIDLRNKDTPYIKKPNTLTVPIILDPITNQNAGNSSFLIYDVIYLFQHCLTIINELKSQYDDNQHQHEPTHINYIDKLIHKLTH